MLRITGNKCPGMSPMKIMRMQIDPDAVVAGRDVWLGTILLYGSQRGGDIIHTIGL